MWDYRPVERSYRIYYLALRSTLEGYAIRPIRRPRSFKIIFLDFILGNIGHYHYGNSKYCDMYIR